MIANLPYKRELFKASGFILFLIIFETILFQGGFLPMLFQSGQIVLFGLIYSITAVFMVMIIWFSFIARRLLQLLYWGFIVIIFFIHYSFWITHDSYMTLPLLDLTTEVGGEAGTLTGYDPLLLDPNGWALVPIIIYTILLIFSKQKTPRDFTLFLSIVYLLILINGAVFLVSRFSAPHLSIRQEPPLPHVSTLDGAFQVVTEALFERLVIRYLMSYYGPRETVTYQASSQPDHNILFIIDESIRGDHLSINGYERDTTPYLRQLAEQGLVYNWGIATSGGTCSPQSVVLLFTGVHQLPDTTYRIEQNPTIFQYAKAMNYQTSLIDAEFPQERPHFDATDYRYIDHWDSKKDVGASKTIDLELAQRIRERLLNSEGNFMVVLKGGAHFPYNKRYPPESLIWQPVLTGATVMSPDQSRLVNSYDNAVRYNVNDFFETLLSPELDLLAQTTILYTSDHGQNLSENGELYTHCKNSKGEANVPLLMISQQPLSFDLTYPASHHNIFATLLDLMAVPFNERRHPYRPSLFEATADMAQPRYYLYGSPYGFGTYGVLPFD